MSLTLLVENNPKIESIYSLNLLIWLGLETLTQNSAQNAMAYLESGENHVQLIIVRTSINKENTAKDLILYLQGKNSTIPVIVVGAGATQNEIPEAFAVIPNMLQIQPLLQSCAKALSITAREMNSKTLPAHYPIPIEHFRNIKRAICPVYIKDDVDQSKFHLRMPKLQTFEQAKIEEMVSLGIKSLYVEKLHRLEFANNVTAELISELQSKDLTKSERISAAEKNLELLSEKLLTLGLSVETIELAKKSIDAIRQNVKSHAKLSSLIERMLSNKSGYLYKHTQILTYVCLHIIKNVDFGTPEQEDKICFIAFFHDIALSSDIHAAIKSPAELRNANLPPEEKQLVERHASIAAEYIQKFPHAPMGADQIIRQHHGVSNGIGFAEHYGATITPIAIVFIVAEEFTRLLLKNESGPFDKAMLLREIKEEFPTSRFQKIVDTLTNLAL